MQKIISLSDLSSLTYKTYRKYFKKMSAVLGVIFLVTVIPVVFQGLVETDFDLVLGWLQNIFGSNLGITAVIFIAVLVLLAYLGLLFVNILLSIGFVQKTADIKNQSFKTKDVFLAGKSLIKPTIWLSIKTFVFSLAVLAMIGIPFILLTVALVPFAPPLFVLIVIGLLGLVALIALAFASIHIAFSQFALYIDGKKELEAIEHSVEIVQGNIWNIISKATVYYIVFFVAFVLGVLALGFIQDIILRSVYGIADTQAMNQLYELRVTGVIVGEMIVTAIVNLVNVFVVFPVTMIASIILYRSLQDTHIAQLEDETVIRKRELKTFIPRLYRIGKWTLLALVLLPLFALLFMSLFS